MLINFRPQARSSTGICVAWPEAQLPLIYFFSSDFVASAWGVEGLPASLGGDNKRWHHCRYPPATTPASPDPRKPLESPRNGERSSWVGGRSESLVVGMSGDSVLADGWPSSSVESPRNPVTPLGDALVTRIHQLALGKKGRGLLSILGRLAAGIVIYSRAPRLLASDETFI